MNTTKILAILCVMTVLLVSSCRSGDVFSNKLQSESSTPEASQSTAENQETQTETTNEATATEGETTSEETAAKQESAPESPEVANVTELPTYDIKDKCLADNLGVVRIFDNEGKKKVFRPFCDENILVTFSCVEGTARPISKNCANGCWISSTKGVGECRDKPLPVHRPKPQPTPE